jgi:hypothetical protein
MSLNPADGGVKISSSAATPSFSAPRTIQVVQAELDAANARIKELESRLAAAGLSTA